MLLNMKTISSRKKENYTSMCACMRKCFLQFELGTSPFFSYCCNLKELDRAFVNLVIEMRKALPRLIRERGI